MVAKLCSFGPTREEAILSLKAALEHYYISGIKTNIFFLSAILNHPVFLSGKQTTHFLEKENLNITVLIGVALLYYQQVTYT